MIYHRKSPVYARYFILLHKRSPVEKDLPVPERNLPVTVLNVYNICRVPFFKSRPSNVEC